MVARKSHEPRDQLDTTLAAAEVDMGADLKKRLDNLTVDFRRCDAAR
jgi:hypothetical protein